MSIRSHGLGRGSAAKNSRPALPRSTPTTTLPQDTGEGVRCGRESVKNAPTWARRECLVKNALRVLVKKKLRESVDRRPAPDQPRQRSGVASVGEKRGTVKRNEYRFRNGSRLPDGRGGRLCARRTRRALVAGGGHLRAGRRPGVRRVGRRLGHRYRGRAWRWAPRSHRWRRGRSPPRPRRERARARRRTKAMSPAMFPMLAAKLWQPVALALLIAAALCYRALLLHQRDAARAAATHLSASLADAEASNAALQSAIATQNTAEAQLRAAIAPGVQTAADS